jgi:hypothetical protein
MQTVWNTDWYCCLYAPLLNPPQQEKIISIAVEDLGKPVQTICIDSTIFGKSKNDQT